MAAPDPINQIKVTLETGNREGAGSKGDVFLQMGPREFNLRLPTGLEERDQGVKNEYTLGEGATIVNKDHNDPRKDFVLTIDELDGFPVCLRFKGQTDDDTWNVEAVAVTASTKRTDTSPRREARWSRGTDHTNNVWLGNKFGNVWYLLQTKFFHDAG
jgi:hypothetical protein